MKAFLKKFVITVLILEAKFVLWRHKPRIVAITGSVGKTSTKDAIFDCLKSSFYTRKSEKSFNSEIGLPLTILGVSNAWNNPFKWLLTILKGFLVLFKSKYPEWLVLEIGIDRPGDMLRVSEWLKTDVVVFTKFSKVPVHVEYFNSPEDVIREKSLLLNTLKLDGVVVLNRDDEDVFALKEKAKRRNISFGFLPSADIHASNEEFLYNSDNELIGMIFRADYDRSSVPVRLIGSVGRAQIYSALAGLSVGSSLGINAVTLSESLMGYNPPSGRMRVLKGVKNSQIIDDTYNSSPVAAASALETLKGINAGRKIAILGDMLELGKYSTEEHRNIGIKVANCADLFVAVGIRMRYAAESAMSNGMDEMQVLQFDNASEAGQYIQNLIEPKDVILVKGSQSMRMEKVVEEIMAEPNKRSKLLVRQEDEWKRR